MLGKLKAMKPEQFNSLATLGLCLMLFFYGETMRQIPADIDKMQTDIELIKQRMDFYH